MKALGSFVVEFSLQLVHLLLVGYTLEVDSFHVGLVATHQLLPLARFLGEQLREPALLGIVNYDEVLHKERADVRPLSLGLAHRTQLVVAQPFLNAASAKEMSALEGAYLVWARRLPAVEADGALRCRLWQLLVLDLGLLV